MSMIRSTPTAAQVRVWLSAPESERLERKSSLKHPERVRDTVCAFSNDLEGSDEPGILLLGVTDQGEPLHSLIPDELLRSAVDLRNSGAVLPVPSLDLYRVRLNIAAEVLVVRVYPVDLPPSRSNGRVMVRKGSSNVIANPTEERLLIERQAHGVRGWDQLPCPNAKLADLNRDRFENEYLPRLVRGPLNDRPYEERLAALRLYDLRRHEPTYGGLMLIGDCPRDYVPGCWLQYVYFASMERPIPPEPHAHEAYEGGVFEQLRTLSRIPEICAPIPDLDGDMRPRYPAEALRELLVNAVLHRQHGQPTPIQFYAYRDRVEIYNHGGLHHSLKFEEFGTVTGYRNLLLAEAMWCYGLTHKFGEGIPTVKRVLLENGNPEAEFYIARESFTVVVRARQPYSARYQQRESAVRQELTRSERERLGLELYQVRDKVEAALRAKGARDLDILAEVEGEIEKRLLPYEALVAKRREEKAERERQIADILRNDAQVQAAEQRAGSAEERVLTLEQRVATAEDTAQALLNRNQVLVQRVKDEEQRATLLEQEKALLEQEKALLLAQQARAAILDLCEVLGLDLTEEQKAELMRMDLPQLAALRSHLKQSRCWPLETKAPQA